MGQRGGWIAVRTDDKAGVLARLGLVETGAVDFSGEHSLAVTVLSAGWVVVQFDSYEWATPERLAAASEGAEAVGSSFWDVVMVSEAWGYSNGSAIWSVSHDPDKGLLNLDPTGEPPAVFAEIRDRLIQEQEQADRGEEEVDVIFDAPMELAAAVCGFRFDLPDLPVETVFTALGPTVSGKAADRQAAQRSQHETLAERIRSEFYPLIMGLGFRRVVDEPEFHQFYRRGGANAFVRRQDEWSHCIEVVWTLREARPIIGFNFFVRRGSEPRYGAEGQARSLRMRRPLLRELFGPRADPAEEMDLAFGRARELLQALDRHLTAGATDPRIAPAEYWDKARSEASVDAA